MGCFLPEKFLTRTLGGALANAYDASGNLYWGYVASSWAGIGSGGFGTSF
jgi:hypothetical protein